MAVRKEEKKIRKCSLYRHLPTHLFMMPHARRLGESLLRFNQWQPALCLQFAHEEITFPPVLLWLRRLLAIPFSLGSSLPRVDCRQLLLPFVFFATRVPLLLALILFDPSLTLLRRIVQCIYCISDSVAAYSLDSDCARRPHYHGFVRRLSQNFWRKRKVRQLTVIVGLLLKPS